MTSSRQAKNASSRFDPSDDLGALDEETLLDRRIGSLPLSVEGTWLEDCVRQLHAELSQKGISFHPECYLADEWLTPQHEPVIGIPFYLAHPALIRLERRMMLEAEGSTREWCLQLLRHEAGHAVSYAYRLLRRRTWARVFGSPSQDYPETFRFRPYSRNYVRHLGGFYAQFHPEEDFVETFAVWLTPGRDWRREYEGWKALDKLLYVDRLMSALRGRPPLVARGRKLWHFRRMRMTLRRFYKRRREECAEEFPDFHDAYLTRIFTPIADGEMPRADRLIGRYRRAILDTVAMSTGERKYVVDGLLKTVRRRCRDLRLGVADDETVAMMRLATHITTLVMNYIYTGWYRGRRKKGRA